MDMYITVYVICYKKLQDLLTGLFGSYYGYYVYTLAKMAIA